MNRELLHKLLDVVLDVQTLGDYASVDFTNQGFEVGVRHRSGGFAARDKGFDYSNYCDTGDTDKLQRMIDYFYNIKKALTPGSN